MRALKKDGDQCIRGGSSCSSPAVARSQSRLPRCEMAMCCVPRCDETLGYIWPRHFWWGSAEESQVMYFLWVVKQSSLPCL